MRCRAAADRCEGRGGVARAENGRIQLLSPRRRSASNGVYPRLHLNPSSAREPMTQCTARHTQLSQLSSSDQSMLRGGVLGNHRVDVHGRTV